MVFILAPGGGGLSAPNESRILRRGTLKHSCRIRYSGGDLHA